MKKHHANICNIAFSDGESCKMLEGIRKCDNINQLIDVCELFEWFYDERNEIAILRCKPCFNLHLIAKPTLSSVTPFRAQSLLNTNLQNGSYASGFLYKKEKSQLMITGKNIFWSRQKRAIIEHLSLLGDGSIKHKKAMDVFNKNKAEKAKQIKVISNVFRGAITTLKLGSAATHFETIMSLLACCGAQIGNIGHSRKNFNDILYCLENVINKRANQWLCSPLKSTGIPPHFWATIDKGTPSRITNQAVLIVDRDDDGKPCPIPVAAPEIYNELDDATYGNLAVQMVDAIRNNVSPEILSRYVFNT